MKHYMRIGLSALLCLALLSGCEGKPPAETSQPPVSSAPDSVTPNSPDGPSIPDAPDDSSVPDASQLPEQMPGGNTVGYHGYYSFIYSEEEDRRWYMENVVGPFDGVLGSLYTKDCDTGEIFLVCEGPVSCLVTETQLYFVSGDLNVMQSDRTGTSVEKLYTAAGPIADMVFQSSKLCFVEGDHIVCYDLKDGTSAEVPGSTGANWICPVENTRLAWRTVDDEIYLYDLDSGTAEQITEEELLQLN